MSTGESPGPAAVLSAGATATGDPYVPGHGTDAYRVLRYELELDYRLASNRLTGRAVLAAVAARRTSAVVLDMTGLRALKVQLNGTRVRKFTQRAEQLVVHCEQPLEAAPNSASRSAMTAIRSRGGGCGVRWAGRSSPTAFW
jgi:hypothetical protein